ncbi:hypothetical protein BUALT_Bualt08G0107600 [Buddleja alternifolia]|uniref:Vesicle-fusing ATPase n=1 Tax=Buddleja alternifolia TaxID=168488 RepID=A0AAV6XG74_9LAMI|nr:hypothetical protein BUALT_Bualt08G0107600 [Buddleja alternifolia]
MVLYGPPGTGKTLIARTMANIMDAQIKVINGPEIFTKYVGDSEKNVREIFSEARSDYKRNGEKSRLHFIVFDEIDSIARRRGSDSTTSYDTVVNQLLTMIDGYSQMNNIFLIGTTNRIELVDPALLRPGRLEITLEINLPDKKGREEILEIHSEFLRRKGFLNSTVDLKQIALETKGLSGADLDGLINTAFSYAIERASGGYLQAIDEEKISLGQEDLKNAMAKARPKMAKHISDFLARCRYNGFVTCGGTNEKVLKKIGLLANRASTNKLIPIASCLLEGPSGTGKTAIAATVAFARASTYVNVISPQLMIGFSESSKCNHILKVLEEAHGSTSSLIIFDDIERLIEYKSTGNVAMTLSSFLTCLPPEGKNVFVIGTTSNQELLGSSGLLDAFTQKLNVPELEASCIEMILKNVLGSSALFQDEQYSVAANSISHVPIKKLYMDLGVARNDKLEFDSSSLDRCVDFLLEDDVNTLQDAPDCFGFAGKRKLVV